MINCASFLPMNVCEAAVRLICDCRDFGETGEIRLEDECISIEVYPYGLAAAPDKLEDDTVLLKILDRDPGGAASCCAGYVIYPKSPSGRARRSRISEAGKEKRQRSWQIPL